MKVFCAIVTNHSRSPSSPQSDGRSEISAPILVQHPREFAEMMVHLRLQSLLAVDTESDSFYRYTPRVCLIQISSPVSPHIDNPEEMVDYLVDPLRLNTIAPLGELLADPAVEVILHAAENDILLLHRDFDFTTTNVFDTQLAARILGRSGVGLAAMLEDEFGVLSDKSMQRTDWGRRPLTPQQMTYAQMDTHYLPALRRRQIERLQEAGRWQEAQDAFQWLEAIRYAEPQESRTVWSMKGTRDVDLDQTGVLEELWIWREETARRLDRPPFRIMNDSVLIALTQQRPATLPELGKIPGLSGNQRDRFGRELLQALQRGYKRPLPSLPVFTPRPEQLLDNNDQKLFQALRQWRSQTAQARSVDPDIVFSNDILLQVVAKKPASLAALQTIPAIGPWKAETYGPALLSLIERHLHSSP